MSYSGQLTVLYAGDRAQDGGREATEQRHDEPTGGEITRFNSELDTLLNPPVLEFSHSDWSIIINTKVRLDSWGKLAYRNAVAQNGCIRLLASKGRLPPEGWKRSDLQPTYVFPATHLSVCLYLSV